MLVVVLNMPEHSSFQDMLFAMLFISKYAKSYASIMDISLDGSLNSVKKQHRRGESMTYITSPILSDLEIWSESVSGSGRR